MTHHQTGDPDLPSNCEPPTRDHSALWETVVAAHKDTIHALIMDVLDTRNAILNDYRMLAGGGNAADIPKDEMGFDCFDSFIFNELVPMAGWPTVQAENVTKGEGL